MSVMPKARTTNPGVRQAKLFYAMCADLRAEGVSKSNATTQMSLAVSWFQRRLTCSRLMALRFHQFRRENNTTGATGSESLENYAAIEFAVVLFLPGASTHLLDELLVLSSDTAVDWTGQGHRRHDEYRYRHKGRATTQF